jgi:hypothetical protein
MELDYERVYYPDEKRVFSVVANKALGGTNAYWDTIRTRNNIRPDLSHFRYRYWTAEFESKDKKVHEEPYLITVNN